ncbi:MAG: hypothetical protein C0392_04090 [Syntrophus sp. (in: bacteria)]|nr:hypothetical protein [Syntrophus sp. (in: bacteria)]
MALSLWTIKLLNAAFVFSFGVVTLWLLYRSLASDRAKRSSPAQRAEFFLRIMRNGFPFLSMPVEKNHYLIGRATGCDIPLKGLGIPPFIGEIFLRNGNCFFKNVLEDSVRINNKPIGIGERIILPGYEISLYNYLMKIE